MKPFKIGNRVVDSEHLPLVIVEIGINHGGDLDVAKQMVDAAFSAGAEVIKHQTHVVDDEMSGSAKKVIPGNADISIYEIMKRCALSEPDEIELKNYVEKKGMMYLSTPFSRAAADRLERLGVIAYKIGSGECNNHPLIEHIASFGKPMIVSTGMNDIHSVKTTVEILKAHKVDFSLLHTTNLYPTPPELVRLGAMQEMMEHFPDVQIGLSDHTTSNLACFSAIALGANIVERHFTDSMKRVGPDIVNSMDPEALSELIKGSDLIRKMRGGQKQAALEEQVTIDFAFASVVAIENIQKGELFSSNNIWVKRPGDGEIPAKDFKSLLGKMALSNILKDTQIKRSDIFEE
ncbi:MAG: N-acetylneuraminate synthase family protein [Porticoccaceae bacterium]